MLEYGRVKVSVSVSVCVSVCVCVARTWNLMLVVLEVLETIKKPQHMTHKEKDIKKWNVKDIFAVEWVGGNRKGSRQSSLDRDKFKNWPWGDQVDGSVCLAFVKVGIDYEGSLFRN